MFKKQEQDMPCICDFSFVSIYLFLLLNFSLDLCYIMVVFSMSDLHNSQSLIKEKEKTIFSDIVYYLRSFWLQMVL